MGSSHTKQSGKSAQTIDTIKTNITKDRINQIKQKKSQTEPGGIIGPICPTVDTWTGIIDCSSASSFIDAIDVAEMQMQRGSANLTKSDLMAIIIALDPAQSSRMYQLNALKIGDLNFIIRSIIYDTRRYEKTPSATSYTPSAPVALHATPVEALPYLEECTKEECIHLDVASAPPIDTIIQNEK